MFFFAASFAFAAIARLASPACPPRRRPARWRMPVAIRDDAGKLRRVWLTKAFIGLHAGKKLPGKARQSHRSCRPPASRTFS
jgi:hypothetical protein